MSINSEYQHKIFFDRDKFSYDGQESRSSDDLEGRTVAASRVLNPLAAVDSFQGNTSIPPRPSNTEQNSYLPQETPDLGFLNNPGNYELSSEIGPVQANSQILQNPIHFPLIPSPQENNLHFLDKFWDQPP